MATILKRLFGGEVNARPPAFSGTMYPGGAAALRSLLDGALADVSRQGPWRAAVVPHSDLNLTASFSAQVWRNAPSNDDGIERYVVIAPALRIPFRGIGVTSKDAFDTPLGPLAVDMNDYAPLEGATMIRTQDEAHRVEPAIELQLPWIRHVAPRARIVPILVGDAATEDIVWVLERLVDDRTALVVACELSGDLDSNGAAEQDARTMDSIESLSAEPFEFGQVSARKPLSALLEFARKRDLRVDPTYRTDSHALGGPSGRVQGFAAVTLGSG